MEITREKIIEILIAGLEKNAAVFALWLEGADALGTVDDYSDIDVWIDVQDGEEGRMVDEIERILSTISAIDFQYEESHPHPKIRQKFFHLCGTSVFLIIDVCIQSHSREFWFTSGFSEEKVKVLFDKNNVIQFRERDEQAFRNEMKERVAYLKKTFPFFQIWVQKEIKRNHFLEALGYYQTRILKSVVELAHIATDPTKREFYLKHISRDMPKDLLEELGDLFAVVSLEDLVEKIQKVNDLFAKLVARAEKEFS